MTDVKLNENTVSVLTIGTWPQWSRKCRAILQSNGTWSYIDGEEQEPPADVTKKGNWVKMNDRLVGALCQVVEDSLAQEIEQYTTVSKAWEHLKTKTYQSGANLKFNALQNAIQLSFTTTATASSVLTDLKDYMEAIYSDKAPTKDEWTVRILLHAMSDSDFDGLRKILMASSSTLTPSSIIQRIEDEVQESRQWELIKNGDTLLAAKQRQTKGSNKLLKCSNCDKSGHTIEKCWEKGGGSEGKAPDWWKTAKEKQRKGTGKTKKEKEHAHAAISEVSSSDSGSESCAILQDSPPLLSSDHSSVDWDNIIASATDPFPYYFDSGATSHCSPNQNDFYTLHPIPAHDICGINGSSISAVAMGTIRLWCGKGRHLLLHNALYIPNVKLCLISIGKLGNMGLKATFSSTCCSILQGSKIIAQGIRSSAGLYHLNDNVTNE
jgi:Pol polyprotein, beta-barrel domain/gag-polypeptide of LTR copia-type